MSEDAPDLAGEVRAVPPADGARREGLGEPNVRAPRRTARLRKSNMCTVQMYHTLAGHLLCICFVLHLLWRNEVVSPAQAPVLLLAGAGACSSNHEQLSIVDCRWTGAPGPPSPRQLARDSVGTVKYLALVAWQCLHGWLTLSHTSHATERCSFVLYLPVKALAAELN